MDEIWLQVVEFEDYYVSNLGRVKSFKNGKERFLNINNYPYYIVGLCKNKTVTNILIHHLVYETFSDNKVLDKECVHHKNEDPTDNRFENLEKITKLEHDKLHTSKRIFADGWGTKNIYKNYWRKESKS